MANMLDTSSHVQLITIITCLIILKICDSNSLVRYMKQAWTECWLLVPLRNSQTCFTIQHVTITHSS